MKKTFSRREVLGMGAAAGAALMGAGMVSGSTSKVSTGSMFPWEFKTLDIGQTQHRAYENYFKGGCMFGVFEAVAGLVAERLGKPFTDFPFQLSTYGGGGVAMWGTLCGTCNGAAMAVSMFHTGKLRNQLINEIFTWYENTALPTFIPKNSRKVENGFKMKAVKAQSTLCHVSITGWSNASGFESYSKERIERCARLVADVAGFTADLLNKAGVMKFKPNHQMSEITAGCLSCHAKGYQAPNEPEVVSKMTCTTCHDDAHHKDIKAKK
jgi:Putative redox-active protein (C_GCAxxG_C_C)